MVFLVISRVKTGILKGAKMRRGVIVLSVVVVIFQIYLVLTIVRNSCLLAQCICIVLAFRGNRLGNFFDI